MSRRCRECGKGQRFRKFECWRAKAKERGFKIRKVSVSKEGEYWQCYDENNKTIIGFFNVREKGSMGTLPL